MSSQAETAANRSNGRKSRGPRTATADPKVGKSVAIPLITPNVHDSWVIRELSETAAGALAVDSLVLNPQQSVPELRFASASKSWSTAEPGATAHLLCLPPSWTIWEQLT
jgi:hypothetical protein